MRHPEEAKRRHPLPSTKRLSTTAVSLIFISSLIFCSLAWRFLSARAPFPTVAMPLSDQENIKVALSEIVQAARTGNVERIFPYIWKEVETNRGKESFLSLRDRLKQGFQSATRQAADSLRVFKIDSLKILVKGDSASVYFVLRGNNNTESEQIGFARTSTNGWSIARAGKFFESLLAFIQQHGILGTSNSFSSATAGKLNFSSSATNMPSVISLVESQQTLIPKEFTDDPSNWKITLWHTLYHLGKKLFSHLDDIDFVPLATSNGQVTSGVAFALDHDWHRIMFAEHGEDWISSYGDLTGHHRFSDPQGMKAVRFLEGTVAVFVADAGNREIVHLNYNPGSNQLTFVRTLRQNLNMPVDVDIDPVYSNHYYPNYRIWVADRGLGSILVLDPNGSILYRVDSYVDPYTNIAYPLDYPEKIAVSSIDYYFGYLSFIDRTENSFVTISTLYSEPYNAAEVNKFNPPSRLSSIGLDYPAEFQVADRGLNEVHRFSRIGRYLASYRMFNSNVAVTPSVFSAVNQVPLFNAPVALSSYNNNNQILLLDSFGGNEWSGTTGFNRFLIGADIVNFSVTYPTGGIQFNYTVTNYSQFTSKIYNQSNQVVYDFAWETPYVHAGNRVDAVQWSELGAGSFTLRITALPFQNWSYGEYQQNPVQTSYTFSPPLSVSISGPSVVFHADPKGTPPNYYTWTANVTGGVPPYSYVWSDHGYGTNSTYSEYFSWNGYGGGSYQFTLRVDVTDSQASSAFAVKNVTAYNSGGGAVAMRGADLVLKPTEFSLEQNFPNPFNPETRISFALPEPAEVSIRIFDIVGRVIARIGSGKYPAGYHQVTWPGTDAPDSKVGSGIYFYQMSAKGESGKSYSKIMKMISLK